MKTVRKHCRGIVTELTTDIIGPVSFFFFFYFLGLFASSRRRGRFVCCGCTQTVRCGKRFVAGMNWTLHDCNKRMGLQKVFDLPTWIRNLDSPSTFTRRYLQYPYRKTYWRQQSKFLFACQNSLGTFFTVLFTNQRGESTKLFVLWGHWKVTGNFSL